LPETNGQSIQAVVSGVTERLGITFKSLGLFFFVGGNKLINRDTGLPDSTPEGADSKFFVPGAGE
jgi:hypothetical protein